jgi:membrane fusion protein (multidrug efflux system)
MTRNYYQSMAVSVIAVLVLIGSSCKEQVQEVPPPPEIQVHQVDDYDIPYLMEFVGQTYGEADLSIRARVEGVLEEIHFLEGSTVQKGQLLYVIDSQPFQAKVAEQQSRVAQAKTAKVKTKSDLDRIRPLAEMNAVSQRDLDAAVANHDAAFSEVNAAKASLRAAEIEMGYTRIYSPITGIIGITLAKPGDFVGREPNPVVLNGVSKTEVILVRFSLTEAQYLSIRSLEVRAEEEDLKRDESSSLTLKLLMAGGYVHEFTGVVDFTDRSVNSSTGTILVQASFPNPREIVRSGQFARVRAIFDFPEEVIMIPQRCITELQGKFLVNLVGENNVIESREVDLAGKYGNMWIVRGGLEKGEVIVLEGLQVAQEGVKITPVVTEFEIIQENI